MVQISSRRIAYGNSLNVNVYDCNKSMIKPSVFYVVFTFLLTTNILTIVGFFMFSDIDTLLNKRSNDIYAAYEDRVSYLRLEVDRLYSRQYAQAGNLNLQIQELSQQQTALNELQPYIKALAISAKELGLVSGANLAPTPQQKIDSNIITGSINQTKTDKNQAYIQSIEQSISQMRDESHAALSTISLAANKSTEKIIKELKKIGVQPNFSAYDQTASGGPFIPIDSQFSSLLSEVNSVALAFDRYKIARKAISQTPIHTPLRGKYRISSYYGARKDPIVGSSAFHSGTDMAAPRGSFVLSAADGLIIFAGRKGGYGNLVEIKHASGLITRYAHLSSFSVTLGQRVRSGAVIAKVGSTGRSTGPHLHFEVRNSKKSLNSSSFIKAGKRLSNYL